VRLLLDLVDGGTKAEVSVIVHDDSNINDGSSSSGESDVLGSFIFLRGVLLNYSNLFCCFG